MNLKVMQSVVAPRFVGKLRAFFKLLRSQSPLCCFRSALSTHGMGVQLAHGSGHRLPLIFWAHSYLSVPPPGSSPAHSAVWNLSPRNPGSTVWPFFHYAPTPKCLSARSADFGGGDPHPCHATSSPYHSPYIRGDDIQGEDMLSVPKYGGLALSLMDLHGTHCSNTSSIVHGV